MVVQLSLVLGLAWISSITVSGLAPSNQFIEPRDAQNMSS